MSSMTVKTGVKNFVERKDPVGFAKDSGIRSDSAGKEGLPEGQTIGDVANQLADPNFIDPSKKMRTTGNNQLDKDAFMKLMLTQMKHQDPTNPLQSHEMAAQLASFTSLEQLQNINSTLGSMKNAQAPQMNFQALSMLGKAVSGDNSKVTRIEGDANHDFKFKLPENASEVTIKVRNNQGEVVKTFNLKNLKAGENKITWNGQDERGLPQAAGEYQFVAEAATEAGKKLAIKTDFAGTITGVNYSAEGPVLLIGNQSIKLSDVKKIIDPSLMSNDQNVQDVTSQDLKTDSNINQNGGKAQSAAPTGNLANVSMSRDMVTKLEKEAGKEITP